MLLRSALYRGLIVLLMLAFVVAGSHGLPRLDVEVPLTKKQFRIGHFKTHLPTPRFEKLAIILPETCRIDGTGPLCGVDGALLASCGTAGSEKLLAYFNQQNPSAPVTVVAPTNDGSGKLTANIIRYLLWPRPVEIIKLDQLASSSLPLPTSAPALFLLSGFSPAPGMPDGQWIAPRVFAFKSPTSVR